MRTIGNRRSVALVIVGVLALAALVVTVAVALSGPRYPGPLPVELSDELLDTFQQRQAEDELLRQRLGGLAALVVDDPELAPCVTADTRPAVADHGDPAAVVQAQTEQLRQLRLAEPVEVLLLDDAEMTDQVSEIFGQQWDEQRLDHEQRVLASLGAVPPDTDLAELRVEVFAGQVSGFFSTSRGVVAVRTGDPEALTPLQRVVLAHEFEHALTSQRLGRPQARNEDAAVAVSALVEGSAVLTMRQYAESVLNDEEREVLRAELLEIARTDPLADFSPYLRAELRFPYVDGLRYVCDLWRDGGWEAVDEAYADPPTTTAEVLFAGRDGARVTEPSPVGEPGAGWSEAFATDVGAAQLGWLLATPGGDSDAAVSTTPSAEKAWAGGELVLWTRDGESAVGLTLVDGGLGPPLCEAVRSWYTAAFPDAVETPGAGSRTGFDAVDQQALLTCDGDQVRLGIAPEAAAAEAIAR